jgi:hypothetical protein
MDCPLCQKPYCGCPSFSPPSNGVNYGIRGIGQPNGITDIANIPAPPSTDWVPWLVGGLALAAAGALSFVALNQKALRNPIDNLGDPEVIAMKDGRVRYKFLHGIYIERASYTELGVIKYEFTTWQVGERGAKSKLLATSSTMEAAKAAAREYGESTQEFLTRMRIKENPTITISLTPEEKAMLQRSLEKNQAKAQQAITAGQVTVGHNLANPRKRKSLWFVDASWHGLDWPMRDALTKKVRGSAGSGMYMVTKRYNIDWTTSSHDRALALSKRVAAAAKAENDRRIQHGHPVTHVRVKIYEGT